MVNDGLFEFKRICLQPIRNMQLQHILKKISTLFLTNRTHFIQVIVKVFLVTH